MEAPNTSKKLFQSRILNLFLAIVVAYVLVLVLVRIFEPHFIFFPNYPDRHAGDWHPLALPVQDVWLTTSDGVKLHAWWIPHGGWAENDAVFLSRRSPTRQSLNLTSKSRRALISD
jgi:hypothetical protein